jgi:hypothetical protein
VVDKIVDRLDPVPGKGEFDPQHTRGFARGMRGVQANELQVFASLDGEDERLDFFGVGERSRRHRSRRQHPLDDERREQREDAARVAAGFPIGRAHDRHGPLGAK